MGERLLPSHGFAPCGLLDPGSNSEGERRVLRPGDARERRERGGQPPARRARGGKKGAMNADVIARALPVIFRELVEGSPDPSARTYVLNQGDRGLLASLEALPAAAASATHGGAPSIAAHVDH